MLDLCDREARTSDVVQRSAVAAVTDAFVDPVEAVLPASELVTVRSDVLDEQKLPFGFEYASVT